MIIVCLNPFLANWGRKKYGSDNVENDKIQYMALDGFLQKPPTKDTYVIYDEIDQMLGTHSFTLEEERVIDEVRAIYKPSIMKQWKSVVGFSGTVNSATTMQMRAELKDSLILNIPSLRKNDVSNRVVKVVKCLDTNKSLYESIE